jgi:8-oxo-dGTP pyrophosphatase MutT (NUDIX family)
LPDEAFTDLQYLQTQVGCPNICAMCSQGASKTITAMTRKGLHDLLDAMKTVIDQRFPSGFPVLGRGREEHKPGVIFPYLDTDVGSDRNLFDLIKQLHTRFGSKMRIASVGYSRHNAELQAMHERIARELPHAIDGFRVSFTPYTYGLHDRDGITARAEYVQDLANLLRTYQSLLTTIGAGKEKFAVEIRHKPLVRVFDRELDEKILHDRHVVRSGPYLLIGLQPGVVPQTSTLTELKERTAGFSQPALPYLVAVSDQYLGEGDWEAIANHLLRHAEAILDDPASFSQQHFDGAFVVRRADGYRFENLDGPFYAIDPTFQSDGTFQAVSFFGRTASRRVSGYNDASRPLLNALIAYKRRRGVGRREDLPDATWTDVDAVLHALRMRAERMRKYDERAAHHLDAEILPLIETYVSVLQEAGYAPGSFFARDFTIDTGQIVNQGRAITQFKGLVTTEDDVIAAHDMRGYGKELSFSSLRDHVWRIAPLPVSGSNDRIQLGYKNPGASPQGSPGAVSVSKLDRFNLYPIETVVIDGVEVEQLPIGDARKRFMLPGMQDMTDNATHRHGTVDQLPVLPAMDPPPSADVKAVFTGLQYVDDASTPLDALAERLRKEAVEQGIDVHCVCGIVVHDDALLVVTRAMSEQLAPGKPEMPGGGVEFSESLIDGLGRELHEEIGAEGATANRLLGHFDITYNETKTRQFAFLVKVSSRDIRLNPTEHMDHAWVDIHDADAIDRIDFHSPGEAAMVKRARDILLAKGS